MSVAEHNSSQQKIQLTFVNKTQKSQHYEQTHNFILQQNEKVPNNEYVSVYKPTINPFLSLIKKFVMQKKIKIKSIIGTLKSKIYKLTIENRKQKKRKFVIKATVLDKQKEIYRDVIFYNYVNNIENTGQIEQQRKTRKYFIQQYATFLAVVNIDEQQQQGLLIQVFERGHQSLNQYIIQQQQYYKGILALNNKIEFEKLQQQQVKIAMQLIKAIDKLHKNRILHNDIKPHNVVISERGTLLKLIDFGHSTFLQEGQNEMSVYNNLGTLLYLQPQLFNQTERRIYPFTYSKANDIYAFAITLYQLVYIKNPYNAFFQNNTYVIQILQAKKFIQQNRFSQLFFYTLYTPVSTQLFFILLRCIKLQKEEILSVEQITRILKSTAKKQLSAFLEIKVMIDNEDVYDLNDYLFFKDNTTI